MSKPYDKYKDYCSFFPEAWGGINISKCCYLHDSTCSTHLFYKCLRKKLDIISSSVITLGGSIGCWVKYTSKMAKRV